MSEPIRVLVVDDHPVVRQGLRTFLDLQNDVTVVAEAGDATSAVDLAVTLRPDVVLLDLRMPGEDGVSALRSLRAQGLTCRVLILTSFTGADAVLPALRAGADGYIYKDVDPVALITAIRAVHQGHVLMHPDVARRLTATDSTARSGNLTRRERDVLTEIARGRSNREIARTLDVSEKTVKTHVSAILTKLGVADRTQAALHAVRAGLV